MIITHNGIESFKVQFSDTTLAFNPISKDSKFKPTKFGADIILVTTDHSDLNGVDTLNNSDKNSFSITGPGEYEIKGITIKGFPAKTNFGGEEKLSTIYKVTFEGMKLLFLGPVNSIELPDFVKEEIMEKTDILFVPIGGDGVLTFADAYKISVIMAPSIVIPMHYGDVGEKDALEKFKKEEGVEKLKPIEKLTVKPKDLEEKEGEVVILKG